MAAWRYVNRLINVTAMSPDSPATSLSLLHERINNCRVCERLVPQFAKPQKMDRGEVGSIVIVGQAPGNKELVKGKAFSGNSGKKLNEWLVRCGANREHPRKGIYLTSIVKCQGAKELFSRMVHNCRTFLNLQLTIIQPRLVITLGQEAFEELRFETSEYNLALCREYRSLDYVLMTPVGFHYSLLPWPHPSGLNRWHNNKSNVQLLNASFEIVGRYLQKQ